MKKLILWEAIATLVGTVIGAGILGIPYVIAKAGFWTGIVNIVFLGVISLVLFLYLGEVALRTKGKHQLTGYAQKYLGKWGKFFMMIGMVFGIYGALVAYLLGVGQALNAIFSWNPIYYSLIFFVVVAFIIYLGLGGVAKSESYLLPFVLIIVLVICALAFKYVNVGNLSSFSLSKIFVPYGVVLFAFLGATAIPEMEMELVRNEKLMKKAIIIGMIIPIVIYILFALFVVGVSGLATTEVATIGLGQMIGEHMVLIGNIFAVIAMTTSFLALGLALKQMYHLDYKISKPVSWGLTCFIPLGIVLVNIATFAKALEVSGVIAGGLTGVLIVFMAIQAKRFGDRKPEYSFPVHWIITGLLVGLFVLGVVNLVF